MLTSELWRTTTFRLTALFGAVFASGVILLLGLVYVQTAGYLTRRVDRILTVEAERLELGGPDIMPRRLQKEAARDPFDSFGLFSGAGERVAGDTALRPGDLIIDGRPRDAPLRRSEPPSRALAERTPWGEILIVERDTRQLVALRHIVLGALIWSGAIIIGLGLVSGVALSLQPLRRITAMRRASEAIGGGDFSMRLPISSARDELDELAGITNRMMDEAERLMTQARTVGQGVAHELRSPLTRLRTMLDHASEAFDAEDPRRTLLESCVVEADTVLARFRALLRIAALEARGRRTGVKPVSLSEIVVQIIDLYGPLAAELGIDLRGDGGEAVTVRADGELLFEALSNLVDNALKFTGTGGHVSVQVRHGDRGPIIEVRDDGPGIPPNERSLVTQRFYRGGGGGSEAPGHGLGLSLVAAVTDLHGFDLNISDARPGTIVKIACH